MAQALLQRIASRKRPPGARTQVWKAGRPVAARDDPVLRSPLHPAVPASVRSQLHARGHGVFWMYLALVVDEILYCFCKGLDALRADLLLQLVLLFDNHLNSRARCAQPHSPASSPTHRGLARWGRGTHLHVRVGPHDLFGSHYLLRFIWHRLVRGHLRTHGRLRRVFLRTLNVCV
jgi:hypothetical protein